MASSNHQYKKSTRPNYTLRGHHSSNTDGKSRSHISEQPRETGDPNSYCQNERSGLSGVPAVSDGTKNKSTVVAHKHGGHHSSNTDGKRPSHISERPRETGDPNSYCHEREHHSSANTDGKRRSQISERPRETGDPNSYCQNERNKEEQSQEEQYSYSDTYSSGSGGSGIVQGIRNFFTSYPKDGKSSNNCPECEKKDEEMKRFRNQTYLFMMEIELHLEGRDVKELSLEWDNFFNNQIRKLSDIVVSETLPCKLLQACYDVVHKTVIELCGTHMECLFKVYDDTAIPEDMKDIKNEKCRCYLKLVSAFEMNRDKKFIWKDVESQFVPYLRENVQGWTNMLPAHIESSQFKSFLTESLQLSWKLATCAPPMIVCCKKKKFDSDIHSRTSTKEESDTEHTLEYHSPVLYTNYTGHVQAKGQVEIVCVSETSKPLCSKSGSEKPSVKLVMAEISHEFKDVSTLQKFAHTLGMPQNRIDLVFNVPDADIKSNLDNIIRWWITRRRIEPQWGKLADAVKNTGYPKLAANIRQKYCKDDIV